jgi:folate-binding protein YgfZ
MAQGKQRCIEFSGRGVLRIAGADRVAFLQGLVSNDVAAVSPERAVYACLLSAQGKFQFDFFLLADGDALLLETDRARLGDLMKRLRIYTLRSAIEIADVSDHFAVLALPDASGAAGAAAPFHGGVAFIDPRVAGLGARAIVPRERLSEAIAGFLPAPIADYKRARLSLGVPESPIDLVPESSTLMESNIDRLNGIAWDKGCYMGQELTARMRYRGLAKKKLMIVRFAGEAPAPATPISDGAREAGEMRSSLVENGEGIGLALVRLEAAAKALNGEVTLECAGTRLAPALPAYLPPETLAPETAKG